MEVTESVVITDPATGREAKVTLRADEVTAILSVGLNALLNAGLISIGYDDDEPTEGTLQ